MEYFTLNNGIQMPMAGIGVFMMSPAEAEAAVESALKSGVRLIDTANGYMNESGTGRGMQVSVTAIKLFSFSYLVGWIDMCFSSLFTALGHPVQSLLVSFFGTLVFPIAFLFILTALWGLNGVWLMASTAAVASGILTVILAKTINLQHPQIPSQS